MDKEQIEADNKSSFDNLIEQDDEMFNNMSKKEQRAHCECQQSENEVNDYE